MVRAQERDSVATAASPWALIRIQPSAVSADVVSRLVKFDESFADNRHKWPTGVFGRFTYALTDGGYSIQRTGKRGAKSGRASIQLPDSLNLNRATTFVIEVDMISAKDVSPEGGLMIGAGEKTGYNLFVIRGQTEFMALRVTNSSTVAPDYRSVGEAITIQPERNTLRVEKHDGKLFFNINGQDVPGEPTPFRPFKGNGIGFVSLADAIIFQNLRVTVGW